MREMEEQCLMFFSPFVLSALCVLGG
jgi:hypothetical protein